jgi:hypothetical protein
MIVGMHLKVGIFINLSMDARRQVPGYHRRGMKVLFVTAMNSALRAEHFPFGKALPSEGMNRFMTLFCKRSH